MELTRRQFTVAATALVSLTVLGCGQGESPEQQAQVPGTPKGKDANRARLAKEPFTIGPADRFAAAGLYPDFKEEKGVWIVSDGQTLSALSATCTHTGCTTRWEEGPQHFKCPCHGSVFDLHGVQQEGSKAKRPLERCALSLVAGPDGGQVVQVDPTSRIREQDKWGQQAYQLSLG